MICWPVSCVLLDSKLWRESNWILLARLSPDRGHWTTEEPSFHHSLVVSEKHGMDRNLPPTVWSQTDPFLLVSVLQGHQHQFHTRVQRFFRMTTVHHTKIPWNLHTPHTYNCWFIMGLQPPLQKLCAGLRKKGCRHQSTLQQHGEALEQQVSVTCSWKMHHFPKRTHTERNITWNHISG